MIVDLARVRAIVSTLDEERFLRFRQVLETRLSNLALLLDGGPAMAAKAQALAHQCHGSATTMGLTALARALEQTERDLRRGDADTHLQAARDLVGLHAAAWRLIVEKIPDLAPR